jgi:REP element-mobilizing transposase RayT
MADLTYYQRNLPHRLPAGSAIFLTIRLADSLPRTALEKLRADLLRAEQSSAEAGAGVIEGGYARQKRYFGRFDALLDQARSGPTWLRLPAIAGMVKAALHHYDGRSYELACYCLMPNHLHAVVFLPTDAPSLSRTLQHLKGYTAQQANVLLQRAGQFWQRESYDHIVRDEAELQRIIAYVLENPVKAGLVPAWQQWPHTYWRDAPSSANF